MSGTGRGPHDVGGMAAGSVPQAPVAHAPWEHRVDALVHLLADEKKAILTVDELRRGVEQLGESAYSELSYYERWMASLTSLLLEKGIVTTDELGRSMARFGFDHQEPR